MVKVEEPKPNVATSNSQETKLPESSVNEESKMDIAEEQKTEETGCGLKHDEVS